VQPASDQAIAEHRSLSPKGELERISKIDRFLSLEVKVLILLFVCTMKVKLLDLTRIVNKL
jgi:hypothetical protein